MHNQAGKLGIMGMAEKDVPKFGEVMRKDGYLLIPVAVLIIRLIIGRSPFDAALWAICSAIFLSFFRADTRLVALPPLIASWLRRPDLGTGRDWLALRAEEAVAARIRAGDTKEQAETARQAVLAAGEGPRANLLRENWMLWAAFGLFAVLSLSGMGAGQALFWSAGALFIFSSPKIMDGLERAAINSLVIGVTAGVMGIVLSGVSLPGIGLKFSSVVVGYSRVFVDLFGWHGSELPMVIIMSGVASYILGMGMTITAAYVLLSLLAVPALMALGVLELNAHLIVLWQCQYASLTPPFALGAFVAAGIAQSDPMRTGFSCLRMAYPLYAIPFLMAYSPILMDEGASWTAIGLVWVTGFIGLYAFSAGLEGFLKRNLTWPERVSFIIAGGLLYVHSLWLNVAGAALLVLGIIWHLKLSVLFGRNARSPASGS